MHAWCRYRRVLKLLLPSRASAELLDRLFAFFDADGNQLVDRVELATGLAMLCGGDRHDRVRASFEMVDTDGDGLLSQDEVRGGPAVQCGLAAPCRAMSCRAVPCRVVQCCGVSRGVSCGVSCVLCGAVPCCCAVRDGVPLACA